MPNFLSHVTGTPVDPAAGTAGVRTLGTGAQQAAAGNHTHAESDITNLTTDLAAKVDKLNTPLAKTANYTVVDADNGKTVVFNTASGAMTATLPAASGRAGFLITIKKLGGATANPLTIDGNASETIDGALTEVISVAGGFRTLICDGSNWHIISGKVEPVIVGPTTLSTAGANMSIDASVGSIYRFTAQTSATTLNLPVPTNPIDGDSINIELSLVTIATSITVNASIKLTGGITSPIAVAAGKKWFGALRYAGSTWYLLASSVES